MTRWVSILIVATCAATAMGDGNAFMTEQWGWHVAEPYHGTGGGFGYLPDSGEPYYSARLAISVTDSDDWTAAQVTGSLLGPVHFLDLTFDPGSDPPWIVPTLFDDYQDEEYTSYYTAPTGYPNVYSSQPPSLSYAHHNDTPTTRDTGYFDTILSVDGDWYFAQFTIVPDQSGDPDFFTPGYWSGDFDIQYTLANTGGDAFSLSATLPLPEPCAAMLLVSCGLLALRRRA